MKQDPQDSHPNQVGYSLANVGELLIDCLDAAEARAVLEIGAYRGELTAVLSEWARGAGAAITTVDPDPDPELDEVLSAYPEVRLIRDTSAGPLQTLDSPDAVILDGDHNYFTLSEELATIAARSDGSQIPLLMFHDIGWPHGRRDSYYSPERVPEAHRQPIARDLALRPENPGADTEGIPFDYAAEREGGPRNGVLTAIEDFMAAQRGLRLVQVPAFFGFGVLWSKDAPYSAELTSLLRPYDADPLIARLEANRVAHLTMVYTLGDRLDRQDKLLRLMLASRVFRLAEVLSRLRRRSGGPAFDRGRVEQALEGRRLPEGH